MPQAPALLNRDTHAHFLRLREFLAQARKQESPEAHGASPEPAEPSRRVGWAKHLVAQCLREAGKPLKPSQIQAWAETHGEELKESTVFYVLRQSRLSRQITRHPGGLYELNA